MDSLNLGTVLFALLLVLWVAYALPRVATRRDVMGRSRAIEIAESSTDARDLSAAVRARRSPREVSPPMTQDRLLLRPADPTSRPRFEADPGERIDPHVERARSRRVRGVLLLLAVAVTGGLVAAAVLGLVHVAVPAVAGVGLAVYVVALRRAEIERRHRLRRAAAVARLEAAERARVEELDAAPAAPAAGAAVTAPVREELAVTAERAHEQVTRRGEWTPRPVPRPTYTMRGEVEDMASRHAAHRASMRGSSLERPDVEEAEALDEAQLAPAVDLHLDEVLARRRA